MTKRYINILVTNEDFELLSETASTYYTTVTGLVRGVALDFAKRSATKSDTRPIPTYVPAPNPQEDVNPAPTAKPAKELTTEERTKILAAFGN